MIRNRIDKYLITGLLIAVTFLASFTSVVPKGEARAPGLGQGSASPTAYAGAPKCAETVNGLTSHANTLDLCIGDNTNAGGGSSRISAANYTIASAFRPLASASPSLDHERDEPLLLQPSSIKSVAFDGTLGFSSVPEDSGACANVEVPSSIENVAVGSSVPKNSGVFTNEAPLDSPGSLTVTGRFLCNITKDWPPPPFDVSWDSLCDHTLDTTQPICWGTVEILNQSNSVILGSDTTCSADVWDERQLPAGNFSITIENPGPDGFYVWVLPQTVHVQVVKPDGSSYICWPSNEAPGGGRERTVFHPSLGQTAFDIGEWNVAPEWADSNYVGAWRIFQSLDQDVYDRGAWDFMRNDLIEFYCAVNVQPVKVRFKMPEVKGSHTHVEPTDLERGTIDIEKITDSKSLDVVQHEYAHWIMEYIYSEVVDGMGNLIYEPYWPPDSTGDHAINKASKPNVAWTEGWADAFPLICQSLGKPFEDCLFEFGNGCAWNLETCTLPYDVTPDPGFDTGDACEGRVAGALYDICDYHNDGLDTFPNYYPQYWETEPPYGITHIFWALVVFGAARCDNYSQFYDFWWGFWRPEARALAIVFNPVDRHVINFCSWQNTIYYNRVPVLSGGTVDPSVGNGHTTFTFRVQYQDEDWDPATSVKVFVYDGDWKRYVMTHAYGDPGNGEWFSVQIDGFSLGSHSFYFEASDGIGWGDDPSGPPYYEFSVENCIHLESMEFTGSNANLGTITFDSASYFLPQDIFRPAGVNYEAQYFPSSGYLFDHWETAGGVSLLDSFSNPSAVTVSGDGTLRAIYRIKIHLESIESDDYGASSNLGTMYFDGSTYALPSDTKKPSGSYAIEYTAVADFLFDHWEWTGDIDMWDSFSNPSAVTVSGDGTLRAIYRKLTVDKNPVAIVSNTTISLVYVTRNSLMFSASGPDGQTGYVRVIFPNVNSTAIKVYIDGVELVPPPFPVITTNGTHWFIYFEFTLTAHNIRVQFAPLVSTHLESVQDNGATSDQGSMYFDGSTYALPSDINESPGTYQIWWNCTATGYVFDHWETTGELSLVYNASIDSNEIVVNGVGTLRAIYKAGVTYSIHFESRQDNYATDNMGTITFNKIRLSLPSDLTSPLGAGWIQYEPLSGCIFSYWETYGEVTVIDAYNESSSVTFNGDGGLTAVYEITRPCYVSLESIQDNYGSRDLGTVEFDGSTYTLPPASPYIIKLEGTHHISYTPASGYAFDHWEAEAIYETGEFIILNPYQASTSVRIRSMGSFGMGLFRAVYKASANCAVHLESVQDNGVTSNQCGIYFDGSIYAFPSDLVESLGTHQISWYYTAIDYKFDHWETTSELVVIDAYQESTSVIVNGAGTLRAIYKSTACTVHLESVQDNGVTSNQCGIYFDGSIYAFPSDLVESLGTHQISWYYTAIDYKFDHWETTSELVVIDAYQESTSVIVNGAGTLRAIYKSTAPHACNLNTGLNYTSIQDAINAPETLDGHTLFVEEGTYNGRIFVNKSISLIGGNRFEAKTTIMATYRPLTYGNVIEVSASNVKITGFTIYSSPDYPYGNGHYNAISLFSSGNNISYNIIRNNVYGIIVAPFSSGNTLSGNNMSYNEFAIRLDSSSGNSIFGNNMIENGYTIWLRLSSNYNSIFGNNIMSHYDYDIFLDSSNYNRISGNNITIQGTCGLYLVSSSGNSIVENNITLVNGYTVVLVESSGNSIFHNHFMPRGNVLRPVSYYSTNIWDDGYPSGGNWWSDYTGDDSFGGPYQNITGSDGIGDTPYIIDANNTDHYPLLGFPVVIYNLTITVTIGGTTNPSPETYTHNAGTTAQVQAVPDTYCFFDHWELDSINVGSDNPMNITMDRDHALHAVFSRLTCTLTITANLGGTTDPTPATYVHDAGSTVSVTAFPDTYYLLDHWELDGANVGAANPIGVLVDMDHALHAVFARIIYTLTVSTTSGGKTDPLPGLYTYDAGTNVSVSAIADPSYKLDYWELDGINAGRSNNPISINMTSNHTLQAVFTSITSALVHDVTVTNVVAFVPHCSSKVGNDLWVFQGRPVYVNVTVFDHGDFDENISVTLSYSTATTAPRGMNSPNLLLSSGLSQTITFIWNTTGLPYGQNYTLTAVATIPADNNPADNSLSAGPITVRILGDINGDGKVDGKDIALVGLSFGSCGPDYLYPGSPPYPRWNLDCDINGDNKIDGKDLTLTALHFGQASS